MLTARWRAAITSATIQHGLEIRFLLLLVVDFVAVALTRSLPLSHLQLPGPKPMVWATKKVSTGHAYGDRPLHA
jgi:hypothetical protein